MTLTHGEVGSMFPSFESWLACDYGGSDDMASEARKVTELLPAPMGHLLLELSHHEGGQAAHGEATWRGTKDSFSHS